MDIDAYTQYSRYETYQNRRPDYSEAILNSIEIAVNLLSKEGGVTLCDFCCGV
jgi:hypothetical protein